MKVEIDGVLYVPFKEPENTDEDTARLDWLELHAATARRADNASRNLVIWGGGSIRYAIDRVRLDTTVKK